MTNARAKIATGSDVGSDAPGTRAELQRWIHDRLRLPGEAQAALFAAVEQVMARQERLWQESKEDAIKALLEGFAERLNTLRNEIQARDIRSHSPALYH